MYMYVCIRMYHVCMCVYVYVYMCVYVLCICIMYVCISSPSVIIVISNYSVVKISQSTGGFVPVLDTAPIACMNYCTSPSPVLYIVRYVGHGVDAILP